MHYSGLQKRVKNSLPHSARADQSSHHSDETWSPRKYSLPDTSIHVQASWSAARTRRLSRPAHPSTRAPPPRPPTRPSSGKSLQTERKRVPVVLRRNVEQMRGAGVQDALTVAPGNAAATSETASAASRDWHPCNNDRENGGLKTRLHERKRHA